MKAKDLIDKLKTVPANTPVLVQGYEDGFDDVVAIREITVAKNQDAHDYNGGYEETKKNCQAKEKINK